MKTIRYSHEYSTRHYVILQNKTIVPCRLLTLAGAETTRCTSPLATLFSTTTTHQDEDEDSEVKVEAIATIGFGRIDILVVGEGACNLLSDRFTDAQDNLSWIWRSQMPSAK